MRAKQQPTFRQMERRATAPNDPCGGAAGAVWGWVHFAQPALASSTTGSRTVAEEADCGNQLARTKHTEAVVPPAAGVKSRGQKAGACPGWLWLLLDIRQPTAWPTGKSAEHRFAPARADIVARDAGGPFWLGNPLPSPLFSALQAQTGGCCSRDDTPSTPADAMHPAKENAAGGFAAKEPVDANVAGTTIKAVKLAGPSRAADEDASNSAQGTGRAQALRKQLAKCRADAAEALKDLAATRERVKKLETARRRAEQRAADAVQQAPWLHLAHSAHLKYSGDRSAAGY